MTTRRAFLASLAAIGAAAAPPLSWAAAGSPTHLAAARDIDGRFALYGIEAGGAVTFRVDLPARGHAGAAHPDRAEAIVFARRPGRFALVLDCARGRVLQRLAPPPGRHFNGHGTFAADGALLFTSEQVSETSEGRVGVWDVAAGYRRAGEFSTHGIGPHELCLMPDGATLVVANGGIATDPADRRKLNIDSMRPNLAYLGLTGRLEERVELDDALHRNSIRHLAVRGDGLVAFAMQWQGAPEEAPPLLGLHRRGAPPLLAEPPLPELLAMRGYAGSVAFAAGGEEVAITSPRGGRLQRFAPDGTFLGALARADICGLAAGASGLLATDGLGGVIAIAGGKARPLARHGAAWDNHLVPLPACRPPRA
ncbi:hypothetical protein SAMN05216257_103434 [Meinhardsimonia xiamenensis]|jgi:hypothetical protein|uniref:Twin-arginine translocation pathway signal n=1 Tax=Meinhardsimonia xiamenensis TaxID=990712 RepID=A0A1G9DCA7_9RHOB|nr:DUF1513 domain-containing protein [Meinhardsimonia xiamenensis]PRX38047.1 hypothetical protein LV81_00320 [Meinhardsimonia xiamenensis]SDK61473.1 hypothetical protein SAMN05216257_103434 [Meinhardsimonia xiamenensis]